MDKPLDEERSQEIAQQIRSKAKQPFENAYKAALALTEALYVQGFLVNKGKPNKPIEHGWLELDDRLIDPNLPHLSGNAGSLFYFPAQHLSVEDLKAAVEEAKEDYPEDDPLPIYGDMPYEYYGDVMLGGEEYQAAFELAEKKCQELRGSKRSSSGDTNGHSPE
ncbi:hypothetical protein [Leptolyngbya ohadii]|uniref:hypothetical protein n=1 Tax=Leptolyngbya ohadii TaxID=1962290 RepID=UPI000B59896B|nr:hypothetical protein [Leptolyngbya ohadii]